MSDLIIWGGTGHARVIQEALASKDAKILAIFDNREICSPISDVPIFYGEEGFHRWNAESQHASHVLACVAIGGSRGADRVLRMHWLRDHGYPPLSIVHERAFVAKDATVGNGCHILAMACVCSSAVLGEAVIVNTKASIDHDCHIGHGVHIAPGATIAGETIIEDFAFIGAGAVVLPRIRIGKNVVIGAGAVVTKNVADGQVLVGNPARPITE